MEELKRIKEVTENYKNKHPDRYVKTCILVWEDCMPSCPFKREHDDVQMYFKKIKYWQSYLGELSCKRCAKVEKPYPDSEPIVFGQVRIPLKNIQDWLIYLNIVADWLILFPDRILAICNSDGY
jgi:hypothetical protein